MNLEIEKIGKKQLPMIDLFGILLVLAIFLFPFFFSFNHF